MIIHIKGAAADFPNLLLSHYITVISTRSPLSPLFLLLLSFVSPMATCFAPVSLSGGCGSHLKARQLWLTNCNSLGVAPKLTVQRKSNLRTRKRSSPISAEYRDGGRGGGADFVAGFLLGGAVFGTLAYIFAPQIRKSLLNENEHGFITAKRPIYYYDDGLERTRQTLNQKIRQLNSAIDSVYTRLRGGSNAPAAKVESDPEMEATL